MLVVSDRNGSNTFVGEDSDVWHNFPLFRAKNRAKSGTQVMVLLSKN